MRVSRRVHQRRVAICGLVLGLATALWHGASASAAPQAQEAAGLDVVRLKLPRGVSLELPRNWTILSKDERVALNEAVSSKAGNSSSAERSFVAQLTDTKGQKRAIVNVRYHPETKDTPGAVTQEAVRGLSEAELEELGQRMNTGMRPALESVGGELVRWDGLCRVKVNGVWVLRVDCVQRQQGDEDAMVVRVDRYPLVEQSCSVSISYRVSEEQALRPVCDRISQSVRVDEPARVPAQAVTQPPPKAVDRKVYSVTDELPHDSVDPAPLIALLVLGTSLAAGACGALVGVRRARPAGALNWLRKAVRVVLLIAVAVLAMVVSGRVFVSVEREKYRWEQGFDWYHVEWIGKWGNLDEGFAELRLSGQTFPVLGREFLERQIRDTRRRLVDGPFEPPAAEPLLVLEDGRITFEMRPSSDAPAEWAIQKVEEDSVGTVSELFVSAAEPHPGAAEWKAATVAATAAAKAFWTQRMEWRLKRILQEYLDRIELKDMEPDQLVNRLSQLTGLPEDVVWKNMIEATQLAKMIGMRDDNASKGRLWEYPQVLSFFNIDRWLSELSQELEERGTSRDTVTGKRPLEESDLDIIRGGGFGRLQSWNDYKELTQWDESKSIMRRTRIHWGQVVLVALGMSIVVGALGYLAIRVTRGPRVEPSTSH